MRKICKGKVRAFTLFELTVAMLLTAIVTALAYSAYRYVGKAYLEFNRKGHDAAELLVTNKQLVYDLNRATAARLTDEDLILRDASGEISYRVMDSLLIRKQYDLREDTLCRSASRLLGRFGGKDVSAGLTDVLVVPVSVSGYEVPFSLTKDYSAEELMNMDHTNNF
ncbi:hypothetical protein GS399_05320 [Pedobacter sp. HMF7647]|uniref:Prepilin-type N-terminal cleavage/methylation domain-containing protein n=1 Tax=Hufsiella arboris TaxID=2695275 RepID=A0A7K1Y739_9SPHI|nr:prepilin-type N-terminal cleavage/methylation domain-containing protein [Hufsiella arboris]MXV50385.1 hypothetical protein [Hufsiella arboris]